MAAVRLWWSARSPREQSMLGVMLALAALVLLVVAVILPLDAARSRAEARLQAATRDAGLIATTTDRLHRRRAAAAPALTVALPTALGAAAEAGGFSLSRVEAAGNARATFAIAAVRSASLFAWLGGLERAGILVDRLTVRPNGDGTIAVEGAARVAGQ